MATHCSTHSQQTAVGACGTCGRPFCTTCRVEDLAEERTYCSAACRDAAGARLVHPGRPASELVEAMRRPVRSGWRLWLRSAGPLTLHVALPIGLAYGSLRAALGVDAKADLTSGRDLLVALAWLALGMAATGVVLSRAHTGAAGGSPWPHVAKRILPWAGTWLVYAIAVGFGGLLILPGMLAGIRLFWADEFALVHGMSPRAALSESLRLTRGLVGRIFGFQFLLGLVGNLVLLAGMVACGGLLSLLPDGSPGHFAAGLVLAFFGVHAYATMHAPEIVYFYGLRALRSGLPDEALSRGDWVARTLSGARREERCPSCGTAWNPADHRTDALTIHCSACKEPLQRPAPSTPGP
jgi:hypothetical protein